MTEEKLEIAFEVDNDLFKEIVDMWPQVLNPSKPKHAFIDALLWLGVFLASFAAFNIFSIKFTAAVFFGGLISGFVAFIIVSQVAAMRYTRLLLGRRIALGAEETRVRIAIDADGIVEQTKTARRAWRWGGC